MKINVTKPSLPELEEFIPLLKEIWQSKVLTNNGPFHQKLEIELCEYLGINNITLFSSGTSALTAALNVLDLKGEVITTPYTFIATINSIIWNNLKPVFVDVDQNSSNICPIQIEKAISSKTEAILGVHTYGNPCNLYEIEALAQKYNLKLIYDAAHAFDVKIDGNSVLNFGDVSILSFHATKVFNTFEGGAVITNNKKLKSKLDKFKNFGLNTERTDIDLIGLNFKMSEFNAALGLLQLKEIKKNIKKRKIVDKLYRSLLENLKGINLQNFENNIQQNYSYFPIYVNEEYGLTRDQLFFELEKKDIICRKYFYPSIVEFDKYKELRIDKISNLLNSKTKANQVICLPIYPDLEHETIKIISEIIVSFDNTND